MGQSFTATTGFSAEGALDDLAVLMNGESVADGGAVSADMEMTGNIVMSEEILEVRDGKIAKIRVTVDTMDVDVSGEVDAMGNAESIDESMEPELVGRTIELSADMMIDDLLALIKSVAPAGEMDELPPGIESNVEATAEFTGVGMFDMALGQMVSLEMAGDFELSINASMEMDGASGTAEVLMSGSMEMNGELTKN